MLAKNLLKWKELNEEEKKATKKELVKDIFILAVGAAGCYSGMKLYDKAYNKMYPDVAISTTWEPGRAALEFIECNEKTQKMSKRPARSFVFSSTEVAKNVANGLNDVIAHMESERFNEAIEAATENM